MRLDRRSSSPTTLTARTVRFPARLRRQIAADAARCGRSFEAQVLAILRNHYGESVDISPTPKLVLSLARGSLADVSPGDVRRLLARLVNEDPK